MSYQYYLCEASGVHVTLSRHSCMVCYFQIECSLTGYIIIITDFESASFVENSIWKEHFCWFYFSIFLFTKVDWLSIWVLSESSWIWVVKKQKKWKRTSAYWQENRKEDVWIRKNDPENQIRHYSILIELFFGWRWHAL